MRPYKFGVELDALREQIHQEHSLNVKYLKPTFDNIRPIQILIEGFLSKTIKDRDERKRVRLAMLSLWVEQELGSSYELTVYQCSIIIAFLEVERDGSYGERAKRFLEDTQAKVEGRDISGEDDYHPLRNEESYQPVRLDRLP
jgi:hypothetical protein